MFEDEARFGRISDPRRCWAPPGIRPEVNTQLVREYEYAFAALCPHDGTLETLVLPSVNTEAMGVFLAEVSQRHAHEFILMVLDGAGWHRAKRLQIPSNMRLIPLPPWSPPLNPVEHLWDETPWTMLQNAPSGAQHKRAVTYFKYYPNLPGLHFDPSHQGPDDLPLAGWVRCSQPLLNLVGKLL